MNAPNLINASASASLSSGGSVSVGAAGAGGATGKVRKLTATAFWTAEIETCPVKDWMEVQGISMNLDTTPRPEGGNAFYQRLIVKGISWDKLTMKRACDEKTPDLMAWVASATGVKFKPVTGLIRLLTPDRKTELATWTVTGITPVSYKGPDLTAGGSNVATDTITLAHTGFAEALKAASKASKG